MAGFKVVFNPNMANVSAQLQKRIEQVPDAINEFATGQAAKMEGFARENAPWTDRTSAARSGIYGQAIREGGKSTIVIYHTALSKESYAYPLVLELGSQPSDNGHPGVAPRPILAPTLAAHSTETLEQTQRIVMSLLGGKVL